LTERPSRKRGDELDAEDVCRRELGMKRWSIAMLAAGVLAYGGMEAQTPAKTAGSQSGGKTGPTGRGVGVTGAAGNVTQARVLAEAGRGENWLVNGGTFESQHFSSLKNITDQNVSGLGLAWVLPIDSRMGLSAEPIVVDGVIYLGAPFDRVYAIDAVTAKFRWQFDPRIRLDGPWRNSYEGRKNRGVAVWNGKVYVGTGDCRVVAINAASGKQVWETTVCDPDQTGITEAPRVGDGKPDEHSSEWRGGVSHPRGEFGHGRQGTASRHDRPEKRGVLHARRAYRETGFSSPRYRWHGGARAAAD
jgi:putative pyrroloquinoline-quinone binding quinoprotein/putative pyrroloquinoline-quinone-binding quinoprotein